MFIQSLYRADFLLLWTVKQLKHDLSFQMKLENKYFLKKYLLFNSIFNSFNRTTTTKKSTNLGTLQVSSSVLVYGKFSLQTASSSVRIFGHPFTHNSSCFMFYNWCDVWLQKWLIFCWVHPSSSEIFPVPGTATQVKTTIDLSPCSAAERYTSAHCCPNTEF